MVSEKLCQRCKCKPAMQDKNGLNRSRCRTCWKIETRKQLDHKKPVDPSQEAAKRTCLMCDHIFNSTGFGNRRCSKCEFMVSQLRYNNEDWDNNEQPNF